MAVTSSAPIPHSPSAAPKAPPPSREDLTDALKAFTDEVDTLVINLKDHRTTVEDAAKLLADLKEMTSDLHEANKLIILSVPAEAPPVKQPS